MLAFLRRDFRILQSYRLAFMLDTFYGVLQLAVFFFISRAFPQIAASGDLGGAPTYFAFAAIGTILGLVVEAASDGLGQRVRDEQLTGTLEALVAEPLSSWRLCAGFSAFPLAFALVRATVYLGLAIALMGLDTGEASWAGVLIMLLCAGVAMAALGVAAGAVVLVFQRGAVLASTALFAMTLISGTVFPVSALPNWLQAVAAVVPLRYAIDGTRDALFQGGGWGPDALALVAFAAVALPLTVGTFALALNFAKARGSLGQY